MSTEKYPYIQANISAQFEFESICPNGAIRKVVTYEMMGTLGVCPQCSASFVKGEKNILCAILCVLPIEGEPF